MKQSQIATIIAIEAHDGQTRRGGELYINHPATVVSTLKNESDEIKAAAWLHDVCEDSDTTPKHLRERGINSRVIRLVKILTKKKGSPYHDYLLGFRGEKDARKIKKADIFHNLSDDPTEKQKLKYGLALRYLNFLDFAERP